MGLRRYMIAGILIFLSWGYASGRPVVNLLWILVILWYGDRPVVNSWGEDTLLVGVTIVNSEALAIEGLRGCVPGSAARVVSKNTGKVSEYTGRFTMGGGVECARFLPRCGVRKECTPLGHGLRVVSGTSFILTF